MSFLDGEGVAGGEGVVGDGDISVNELEPCAAAGCEVVGDGFAGGEADAVDVGVLMDGGGVFAAVRGDDEDHWRGV